MKILGIVGGIGAGKTSVVSILQANTKCFVIGADEIGHQLLLKEGKAYEKVLETFGRAILDDAGNIVRARLGAIVFKDKEELVKLNQITHPLIHEEVQAQIDRCRDEGEWTYVIIDAALLIEIGLVSLTDEVVGVYADEETRVNRIIAREGFTRGQALDRINKQKNWEELEKVVNYVIDNSGSYDHTVAQVKEMIASL